MKQSLKLKIVSFARTFARSHRLEEVLGVLERNDIGVVGRVNVTPKERILQQSLRAASEEKVEQVLSYSDKATPLVPDNKLPLQLHLGFVGTKVEKYFLSGDYGEAVRVAFLRINNRVKKLTNASEDGVNLMRKVFSKNKPLIPMNKQLTVEDSDEQEGLMHIFEGAILAFRNPVSHDDEREIDRESAMGLLMLANYLMRRIDVGISQ